MDHFTTVYIYTLRPRFTAFQLTIFATTNTGQDVNTVPVSCAFKPTE